MAKSKIKKLETLEGLSLFEILQRVRLLPFYRISIQSILGASSISANPREVDVSDGKIKLYEGDNVKYLPLTRIESITVRYKIYDEKLELTLKRSEDEILDLFSEEVNRSSIEYSRNLLDNIRRTKEHRHTCDSLDRKLYNCVVDHLNKNLKDENKVRYDYEMGSNV